MLHVDSVDADWNNNFCIYLTEDGNLYGLGLNMAGLLLGKDTVKQVYSDMNNDRVCTPTLLMKNVRYARAGREAIIVLKEDGTVYWWGQLRTTSSTTVGGYDEYWSVTENPLNLVKMMYLEPHKVLDHCIYVDINAWNGAAITEAGELYLWGLNIFGQCGISKSENVYDFVREPKKVLDKVSMVWLGGIRHNDDASTFDADISAIRYGYNNFALLEDGTLLGAGDKLGKDSVTTVLEGDLYEAGSHRCSFSFVPVKAVVYSLEYNREVLSRMQWGMRRDEVRTLCTDAGLQCDVASEDASLYIENSKYYCYFDENGGLDRIQIQAGSSRDGRFLVDKTTLEELQRNIADADGTLTLVKSAEEASWERWQYEDIHEQIRYYFTVYEGIVTVIEEEQMTNEEAMNM